MAEDKQSVAVTKLKTQLKGATSRVQSANEQLKALRSTLAERKKEERERVAGLQKSHVAAQSRLQRKLERCEALLASEQENVKELREQLAQERQQVKDLGGQLAQQRQQERELQAHLKQQEQERDRLAKQAEAASTLLAGEQKKVKSLTGRLAQRAEHERERVAKLQEKHASDVSRIRKQVERQASRAASEGEKVKALRAQLAERSRGGNEAVGKLREQLKQANARTAAQRERTEELKTKHAAEMDGLQTQLARALDQAEAHEEQARALRIELAERDRRDRALMSSDSGHQQARGSSQSADGRGPAPSVDPPIVLIGSAGSSGSHLVAVLLAGRKPFYTGPEANLASRPDLFDPASFDLALFKGLMRQEPYFRPVERTDERDFHFAPPLVLSNGESYGIEGAAAKLELLEEVSDWPELIRYLHRGLAAAGTIAAADVLIDHSPSCAVSLAAALDAIPNLKVLHLVRDPRDAIASRMSRRGATWQFESLSSDESLTLMAKQLAFVTAAALQAEGHPGYMRMSYEELVSRPEEATEKLSAHFGFPSPENRPGGPLLIGPIRKQEGWAAAPTDAVTEKSVGRYKRNLDARQLKRLTGMRFDFPELEQEVSMGDLIERFAASETAAVSRS